MNVTLGIIIIAICVVFEAFFSGSEIALVSIDRLRLKEDARRGKQSARLILKLLEKPERILGITLLGTNVATIINTTVSASVFFGLLGPKGIPISLAVITPVNWILCEIVPKSIFQQFSDEITSVTIYALLFFYYLFYPVVWLLSSISRLITTLVSGANQNSSENGFVSKEELQQIMNMRFDHSDVKPGEKSMISKVLDFNDITVKEVMVPLINVTAIEAKSTVEQASKIVRQSKHRRLPVFNKRIDKIIGIINTFDLLEVDKTKKISALVRPTHFIPPSMKVADLLEEIQRSRKNMAIVVDEYGGAEGIITIEDILEEVVGEIEDEYDGFSDKQFYQNQQEILVKANMEIDDFNQKTGLELPEGDYNTVGGFFLDRYGRIPKKGESLLFEEKKFIINKANEKTILEIKIINADTENLN
jgi:CBS domain containing-hemolysin-like protein